MMNKDLEKRDFDQLYKLFLEKEFEKFLDEDPVFESINAATFDLARKAYIAGCKYSYEILTKNGANQ